MITRRLDTNHDMTFGQGLANFAIEAEATAQRVYTRLQLLNGEWFLNTDAGIPYLQEILVKPENLPLAESLIKKTILQTDGIQEITAFDMIFDRATRKLDIAATVTNEFGTTQNIKVRI